MQQTSTFLLRGGLNLVTPPLAIPAGQAIAALNYEPDVSGYRSHGGYERYDGQPAPSEAATPEDETARRSAITAVPGTGPVRGVAVYRGNVYAFRDHSDGNGRMYRDSASGWTEMTFGKEIAFSAGTAEFVEGETLAGGTSLATATIDRVVLQSGAWGTDAQGFLIVSDVVGTFQAETGTSSSGSATIAAAIDLTLTAGGFYSFTAHNFYGGARSICLYFANGQGNAWEWDGEVLAPVRTGTAAGIAGNIDYLLADNGDFILADNSDNIILAASFDRPLWVAHFANHLFLGYDSGSLVHSSLGEPLEYITTTGAGEIAFGEELTGILATTTALVVFGRNAVDYLVGSDSSDFLLQHITENSGALPRSPVVLDTPVYVDDGGIRSLSATAAFGDWRMGTMSALVEPLIKAKRDAGVQIATALAVKSRDQHRLFWDDGTGLVMYVGRKQPEILPFKLPSTTFSACAGEITQGEGERVFVGSEDGYVYELGRGTSFDGAAIPTYLRLAFNQVGTPTQRKLFRRFAAEMDSPDDITVGIAYDVDYARGTGNGQVNVSADAGTPIVSTEDYGSIDWTQAVQGLLEHHVAGIGKNLAVTFITSAADKEPHTLASATINFSPRGLVR